MNIWQLQEAKAKLSELIRLCEFKGPQILTVRGQEEAVLLSKKEYDKLIGGKNSLIELMQNSPLKDAQIIFERDGSSFRDVDL